MLLPGLLQIRVIIFHEAHIFLLIDTVQLRLQPMLLGICGFPDQEGGKLAVHLFDIDAFFIQMDGRPEQAGQVLRIETEGTSIFDDMDGYGDRFPIELPGSPVLQGIQIQAGDHFHLFLCRRSVKTLCRVFRLVISFFIKGDQVVRGDRQIDRPDVYGNGKTVFSFHSPFCLIFRPPDQFLKKGIKSGPGFFGELQCFDFHGSSAGFDYTAVCLPQCVRVRFHGIGSRTVIIADGGPDQGKRPVSGILLRPASASCQQDGSSCQAKAGPFILNEFHKLLSPLLFLSVMVFMFSRKGAMQGRGRPDRTSPEPEKVILSPRFDKKA